MSNETKQHTPTPWFQSHREGQDGGYRTEIYDTTGETIAILTWYAMPKNKDGSFGTYREANAKRIIACVNAMEGIEAPENYRVRTESQIAEQKQDIIELEKYKVACESINPDNPMAVAENLGLVIGLFEYCLKEWGKASFAERIPEYEKATELLNVIQNK